MLFVFVVAGKLVEFDQRIDDIGDVEKPVALEPERKREVVSV